MRKLIILLSVLFSSTLFAQKPMISFTPTEIKERNRLEFGTTEWKKQNLEEFWTLYTVDPDFDLMTMYFFRYGSLKNEMCSQFTKSDDLAIAMLSRIIETHHNLGDNKYLSNGGIMVHYKWEDDLKTHRFMYYNPEGKKNF